MDRMSYYHGNASVPYGRYRIFSLYSQSNNEERFMEEILSKLNENQRDAVIYGEGPSLVVAGRVNSIVGL